MIGKTSVSRVRVKTNITGTFLHKQQGGGLTQRLVHRSFTRDITLDIRPLSRVGDTWSAAPPARSVPAGSVAVIVGNGVSS